MTERQPNARTRPTAGVVHENHPHHDNFTVVGNHLLQHPELSLTAIGLAVHIQSLPAGTPVGIKTLAGKFPEGEIRIAAALRELEEHGYLARTKERLQSGRVVTRTISFNRPGIVIAEAAEPSPPATAPPRTGPRTKATDLLATLRTLDTRLLLTEREIQRLAPAVNTWLDRGVPPTAVQRVLTSGLPDEPLRHPAAFLNHRLTTDLPPLLPTPLLPTQAAAPRPTPLQTCDGCERAFRSPTPGHCRDCRPAQHRAA
ncbi:helix-turn-helix domain-containing protein [Streptomyces sp. NPDC003717]|uniref:helix-turn-helix domain-containing protein n=1 Tax=Streptomyces sp. NPDC003717 TaxID=3154276 RepID=UPI0033B10C9D